MVSGCWDMGLIKTLAQDVSITFLFLETLHYPYVCVVQGKEISQENWVLLLAMPWICDLDQDA